MKNRNRIIIILVIICIMLYLLTMLLTNKTFCKNTYIGVQGQEIYIPKFSFFKREAGMTVAIFDSLRSEESLRKEIDDYMKEFEYFEDESTYGYKKGDLFIQSYEVIDEVLYRRIYITY